MSDTYTKLFSSITESTVWGEPYSTRIVWVTMLAMADRRGSVYGSLPGLARRANVSLGEAESAITSFMSPDPYSRTRDEDGRRIEEIEGGWRLINHAKYSAIRGTEERRDYKREWDRDNRPSGAKRTKTEKSDNGTAVRQQSDKSDTSPTNPTGPTPLALTPDLEELETPNGVSCASADADAPRASRKPIPFQAIVDAYNRTLTGLSKVREVNADRRTLVRRAWQASAQRRSIEFWEAYFAECQEDPFLNGAGPYTGDHANWRPSFDYLLRPKVVTRVFEGAMDRMERSS